MSKFTKTLSTMLAVMLISVLAFGQAAQKNDALKMQQMQEQFQDGTPGEYVGTSNFDYTKLVNADGTKDVLWDNGGFVTAPGAGSGGTDYSELQDASLGMGTYGTGFQISASNSVCDDFDVTGTWNVTSFTFFGYQTGSGPPSTLNDVRVQIWDGIPTGGGSVIWGDLTTNLMSSTDWTNAWRVLESAPSENRPIMNIVADVTGLVLAPGTYWVEYSVGGTGASGPWAPYVTIVGETTTGNAIQNQAGTWVDLIDIGPQGMPFIIEGTVGDLLGDDLSVTQIIAPSSGMLLGVEDVTVKVLNMGENTQTSFDVSYTFEGGSVTETVSATLASLESLEYTFATPADVSGIGTYNFEACVDLAGDENPDNDCATKEVTNAEGAYCDASTTTEDEWIANVLCGDIDNSSGWQGGVADYTAIYTTIPAGGSETMTVTNGNAWASDIVYAWVDWNDNFEFEMEEEYQLENVGGTGETFVGDIVAPADAPAGMHRMRVRMTYSTAPTPCGNASYGEVEDYSIMSGDPTFGNLEGTVTDADSGDPIEGATVTAGSNSTTTDSDGDYSFMDINTGTYTVSCTASGYVGQNETGVVVLEGQTTTLDFAMVEQEAPPTGGIVYEDDFEDYNAGEMLACQNPEDIAARRGGETFSRCERPRRCRWRHPC